ncbi:protein of unknown function (plasmid) [Cupriavidus taiwanensis]|uniref:Uncharacterized protein n=1 Tax=Cupriavidus taiwanensis TaxID=164546 RepID=A0A375FIC2_9BURK|nr:protein of unknown function [Cupriavidus taiwanensis]SPA03314.1 protein of unknown function [Cupriavidus taiwanensis]SPA11288.1 protein of unknown function [Cupriavidus taiwanensis]SPA57255.1 protein of unknown function [Cupriavidus taiwanensis]
MGDRVSRRSEQLPHPPRDISSGYQSLVELRPVLDTVARGARLAAGCPSASPPKKSKKTTKPPQKLTETLFQPLGETSAPTEPEIVQQRHSQDWVFRISTCQVCTYIPSFTHFIRGEMYILELPLTAYDYR